MNQQRSSVLRNVDKYRDEVLLLTKTIHDNPETAFKEHFAVKTLTERLSQHGVESEIAVGGLETAFIARAKGGRSGPKIALIAEYDALPGHWTRLWT